MIKMKNTEFVAKAIDIANNYKTLYVMGCFGAPMNEKNKARYIKNHEYNRSASRAKMINAASDDTFGFDCVCLVKGLLWGWNGDKNARYGGAKYKSNGVPEIGTESMICVCSDVSSDFSKIEKGELLWLKGHVGIYIGNGMAVECTPAWDNKVQITACNCTKSGYNRRNWTKHGKLPYIEYVKETVVAPQPVASDKIEYNIGKEDKPSEVKPAVNGTPSTGSKDDEKKLWDVLLAKIGNEYGVAGLMGNLYAESALRSNNLQQTCEKSLGFTDESYTSSVDNGSYTNFIKDSAGYGLAQWTYWSRKQGLLEYAQSVGKSIGDFEMQMEYLIKELETNHKSTLKALKAAQSVFEASTYVLVHYEAPADQGEAVQAKRASYGEKYYSAYHTVIEEPKEEIEEKIPEENTNQSDTNDGSNDNPVETPAVDGATTDVEKEPEYIKTPEEAQNFIMKLLNHLIDFIVRLFKKMKGDTL